MSIGLQREQMEYLEKRRKELRKDELPAWTIKQLYDAMLRDLSQCTTDSERAMCDAMCVREIREFARSMNRKPTPMEQLILDQLRIQL